MTHFEEHPYACIKNGKVDNVIVFSEHDEPLVEKIKTDFEYDTMISLCEYGSLVSRLYSYNYDTKQFYLENFVDNSPAIDNSI